MFTNREQAAMLLAIKLEHFKGEDTFVFAIPRGATIMGKIIAERLSAPFDILVVRKIGAAYNPELAIGAVGPEGVVYWDNTLCRAVGVTKSEKLKVKSEKLREREDREKLLRKNRRYPNVGGKTVLIVDDGVATGATTIAAGKYLAKKKVKQAVLVTPVIAKDTLTKVKRYFDEVIYLEVPEEFHAVGQFYEEFNQVTDDEVIRLLKF